MNWQRGISTALMGVGANYQNNYDRYKQEQAKIAQENRMYETTMRKEKELYARQQERGLQERNAKADAMEASGGYAQEEIDAVRGGLEVSSQFKQSQALEAAGAAADLETEKTIDRENALLTNKVQMANPNLTPEQVQQEVAKLQQQELARVGKTAAELNAEAVQGILSKYEGEENPTYSKTDKIMLAIHGVKIPEEERLKLTSGDHTDLMQNATKYGTDMWGDSDKISDVDVVNYVNQRLPEGRQPFKPSDAPAVRQMLVRQTAKNRYIFSVTSITGTVPTETPDGQVITDEDATDAIIDVEKVTAAANPNPNVQPEAHAPGQQIPGVDEGTFGMPETQPQAIGTPGFQGGGAMVGPPPPPAAPAPILRREPGESNEDYQRRIRQQRMDANMGN